MRRLFAQTTPRSRFHFIMIVAGISGTYEAAPTATTGKMSIENQAHENAEYGYFPWHVNPLSVRKSFLSTQFVQHNITSASSTRTG